MRPPLLFLELWLGTPGTRRAEAGDGGGGISAASVRALGSRPEEDAEATFCGVDIRWALLRAGNAGGVSVASESASESSLPSFSCGSSVVLTSESYFSFTAVAGMYTGRRIRSIQRSEGCGVQKQREYVCRIMVVAGEKGLQVRHARLKVSNRSHVMASNACLKRVHWD